MFFDVRFDRRVFPSGAVLLTSVGIASLAGCVSPDMARPARMVPRDLRVERSVGVSACVVVDATDSVTLVLRDEFTKEAFAKAVDLALVSAGVFEKVVKYTEQPQFLVTVRIVHIGVENRFSPFDTSGAAIVAEWELRGAGEEEVLWSEEIITTHRCGSFRPALERACNDNIRRAILEMSSSRLKG